MSLLFLETASVNKREVMDTRLQQLEIPHVMAATSNEARRLLESGQHFDCFRTHTWGANEHGVPEPLSGTGTFLDTFQRHPELLDACGRNIVICVTMGSRTLREKIESLLHRFPDVSVRPVDGMYESEFWEAWKKDHSTNAHVIGEEERRSEWLPC
ncbi:MAG: hypothetical protein WCS85_04655 [Candidatus Peribacteraceae bacterium]|jgi:hypothetical protein